MTGTVEKRCACGEAKWYQCPDAWYLKKIRVDGKEFAPNLTRHAARVLAKTITTKTEAEAVAALVRPQILSGTYVAAREVVRAAAPIPIVTGRTLAAVVEDFTVATIDVDPKKKPNSKLNDRAGLACLCAFKHLGARPMEAITFKDLVAWRGSLSTLATSTWNKRRTVVAQLWRWAARHGHVPVDLLATAHADDLKLLRRGAVHQRSRVITPDLLENLLEAAREQRTGYARLHALLVAAIETGCRVGELLALRWLDVVWTPTDPHLLIRAEETGASKSKKRKIEISAPLVALLERLQTDPAGQRFKGTAYIFGDAVGGRVKRVKKAWMTAVLRAHNITPTWTETGDLDAESRAAYRQIDLHIHDLRHHAASTWLASKAFDLKQVSERLGHADTTITATYLHTTSASLRAAQAAFDALRAAQPPVHPPQAARAGMVFKTGKRGDKQGTNANGATIPPSGPRLVKGRKS